MPEGASSETKLIGKRAEGGTCFHRSCKSIEERRELWMVVSQASLWSLDLKEHLHFLPSSSMGVLEEIYFGRVEHGTDPLGLLSNLWKQGKNVDNRKEGRKEGDNGGEMFEIISHPN